MMETDNQRKELFLELSKFKCGECESFFVTLYQLHDHLRNHAEVGSYRYFYNIKTAFAALASCDASTQTCKSDITDTKTIKTEHLDLLEGVPLQGTRNQSIEILENTRSFDAYDEETDIESDNGNAEERNNIPEVTVDQNSGSKTEPKSCYNNLSDRLKFGMLESNSPGSVNKGDAVDKKRTSNDTVHLILKSEKENGGEHQGIRHSRQTTKRNRDVGAAESIPTKCRDLRVCLTKLEDMADTKIVKTKEVHTESRDYEDSEENKNSSWQSDNLGEALTNDHNESDPKSGLTSSVKMQNFKEKTCKICKRQFMFYSYLRRHCIEKHKISLMKRPTKTRKRKKVIADKSGIQCDLCHKQFKADKYLHRHKMIKHNFPRKKQGRPKKYDDPNGLYQCDKCDRILHLYQKPEHDRYHGIGEEKYHKNTVVCDVCGLLFSKSGITSHAKTHTVELKECKDCNLKFNTVKEYDTHKYQVHYKKAAQCNVCGTILASKKGVNQHIRSVHMNEKNSQCDICGAKFFSPYKLKRHKLIHGEAEFQCSMCERKFKDDLSMRRHQRIHTQDVSYVCHICNHGFIQSTPYWSHMQKKHSLSKIEAMAIRQQLNINTITLNLQ